jgi:hypothetical protein
MPTVASVPPSTYVIWYKVIDVWTDRDVDKFQQASVTRYLCNLEKFGGLGDSLNLWQSILTAGSGDLPVGGAKLDRATQVFYGKGTPDDVAIALRVVDYVARKNLDHPALAKFKSILSGDDRLASVCEKYIGVDCNGFVGNYAKEMGVPQASPNLVPGLWKNVGPINKWRSSVADIQPFDVLIFPSNSHIAMVDKVSAGTLTICQSTGPGGPQTSSGHSVSLAAPADGDTPAQFTVGTGMTEGGEHPSTLPNTVRIKSIGLTGPSL